MFSFYLDNNLVSDPVNWGDFTETILRDDAIKALLIKYESGLDFSGSAYNYLYSQYLAYGFCKLVSIRIDYKCTDSAQFETLVNGFIFISDCRFNLNKCLVSTTIIDNNYGAKIYNNKTIKTYLNSDKSKNSSILGNTISVGVTQDIQFFTPTTGVYSGSVRKLYRVYDAFKYLIDYISDGTIGFESSYLSDVNGLDGLCVTTGKEIRTATGISPVISFQDLFIEVNKMFPIGLTVIIKNGIPTIKIEEDSFFYSAINSIKVDNIEDLTQSFSNEKLYSSVRIGSQTASFNPAIHHLIPRQFIGFQDESYTLTGECNIDRVLDLYNSFSIDSNIIEGLFATDTSNVEYDDNTVFVYCDIATGKAKQLLNSDNIYYYNSNITNDLVSARNSFNGDAALYGGLDNSGFKATKTYYNESFGGANDINNADFMITMTSGDPPFTTPVIIELYNDTLTGTNFNLGGNYNPANGKYTVPLAGAYYFENVSVLHTFPVGNIGFPLGHNIKFELSMVTIRYNSLNVFQEQVVDVFTFLGTTGVVSNFQACYMDCAVGDYIQIKAVVTAEQLNPLFPSELRMNITNGSTYRTVATTSGGGIYKVGDNGNYFVAKLEFDKPLSNSEYQLMKFDLSRNLIVNHDGTTNKKAWIRKTVRNVSTGSTKWELLSSINNI